MSKLSVTSEVTQKVAVKLSPKLVVTVQNKLREYAALSARIKKDQDRQDAVKKELETVFESAGEFGSLIDGVRVDGYSIKVITGTNDKLDTQRLMRTHNLTQADLDACTDTRPKRPYLQVSAPRTKKGDE